MIAGVFPRFRQRVSVDGGFLSRQARTCLCSGVLQALNLQKSVAVFEWSVKTNERCCVESI